MEHVHKSCCDGTGIKLFGATISVQVKDEPNNKIDHDPMVENEPNNKIDHDPTVEKRPDKIIACPRCKSMETKFCYFNNYNVNQPRHFCKGCQRYWTAGGALRNVPVGAGRRKNKPVPCRGLPGFSDGRLYDGSGFQQFDFDHGVVEGWRMVEHGGFRQVFPAKRPRTTTGRGQTC